MKKVYVFVFDGLADWEIGLVTYALHTWRKIKVTTVGYSREPIITGGGLRILPEISLSEMKLEDTMLFILPGGEMWHHRFDKSLEKAVIFLHTLAIPVAAICGATVFLAKAGLLQEGIRHTSNSLDYLRETVPAYTGQDFYQDMQAVSDQGFITAGGQSSAAFAYQILKTLGVYSQPELDAFAALFNCREVD